ncbi:heterokaryon incompatibility protein-domain-containing protein [Xylariaceae sp. FL0255]|nr:heterokaryon incompatibility protein-domain-containing protein [Xylariaceae sp. FL0255]
MNHSHATPTMDWTNTNLDRTIELLRHVAGIISPILLDLSNRDARFIFIKESLDEFLYGDHGLHVDEWQNEALETVQSEADDTLTDQAKSYLVPLCADLCMMFSDITNAAIYELLDIYDMEIALPQALKLNASWDPSPLVWLLQDLHRRSKELTPRQAKTRSFGLAASSTQERSEYQYLNRLDSSKIRMLVIQPGLQESPIECQLEERNLANDIIEETLSYVWGEPVLDSAVKIDGKSLRITSRLAQILRSLRYQDRPRKIWIDAVCICQSDAQEKASQVRAMKEIYSKTLESVIWLGDLTTPNSPPLHLSRDLAENCCQKTLLDQWDLTTILEEILKYQDADPWDERRFALNISFIRSTHAIRKHEWWKRVWTIQEAVLPLNDPIVWFCGRSLPLNTVISIIDSADSVRDMFFENTGSPGKHVHLQQTTTSRHKSRELLF